MSTNEKNSKKGENKMSGRYINPYTDFGFKYLFGTEPNKDITLELVNALLQGKEVIKSLTLLPTEQLVTPRMTAAQYSTSTARMSRATRSSSRCRRQTNSGLKTARFITRRSPSVSKEKKVSGASA